MILTPKEIIKKQAVFTKADIEIVAVFKVLSDINRYRIFRILADQPKISVTDIARILNISVPLASQHLKILAQNKMLQKERDGKKIFPKIERDNAFVHALIKTIKKIFPLNNA